ncbi:MAG: UMP kinase [Candidatus Marinimicrobia bacterium]|jgi:uridylate kinase|nr:UMP kinase [Candidatus Neomarinimicrobiota bacterium]
MNYNRILLKLSGEVLAGNNESVIDTNILKYFANEIRSIFDLGIEIAIVIGGGNIYRGAKTIANEDKIGRIDGDYMGMLATVINSLALKDSFEAAGIPTRVMSALNINEIVEPFVQKKALRHLSKGRVVIFCGGTGHPYFSTDTAAALRSAEIDADILLKGTKVDGVFDSDPELNVDAKKYESLSYSEVLKDNLRVMDLSAITLCKENKIPINVFNFKVPGTLKKLLMGEYKGTKIGDD